MRKLLHISSARIEDIERHISETQFPVRLKPLERCESYGLCGHVATFDGICLQWSKTIGSYEITSSAERDSVGFLIVKSGFMRYHFKGSFFDLRKDSAITYDSCWKIEAWNSSEYCNVVFSKEILQRRLAVLLDGSPPRHIAFLKQPVYRERAEELFSFISDLETSPMMALARLMRHRTESVADVIIDAFLLAYPNSCIELLSEQFPKVAPKHVKRAVDFIHSNPEKRHSPEALASLSSVSVRSLQYSFKAFMGHTISEYQHLLRLRGAHQDLVNNPLISLTEVAEKWGFGSLSSFGQAFKKAYGQTPSSMMKEQKGAPHPLIPRDISE